MEGTWTKVQTDVRVCIYSGQVRTMRTRGLSFCLAGEGKCKARSGQVRFGHRKGRSGDAGGKAEARLARKRAMMKQGNRRQWDVHMHVHVRTWTYKSVRASKQAKTREKEGGLAMDGRADEMDGMVCRGRTEILNVASERLTVAGALFCHSIHHSPNSGHHLPGHSRALLVIWWVH